MAQYSLFVLKVPLNRN